MSTSMKAGTKVRVLIVDDHAVVREGLSHLLGCEADIEVLSSVSDRRAALAALRESPHDLAIVDISLGKDSGLDLLHIIRREYPATRMLVLSMYDERLYAERAIQAGAHGYVMKLAPPDEVLSAIREILSGDSYLSRELRAAWGSAPGQRSKSSRPPSLSRLSDRELEVLRLLGQGHGSREIAAILNRSVKTIETHRAAIKRKLEIRNNAELLQRAVLIAQGVFER